MKTLQIIKRKYGLDDEQAVRFVILKVLGRLTDLAAIKIIRG